MSEYGCKKMVFSSSATVYGEHNVSPLNETMKTGGTTNPYGTTKLFIEQILKDMEYQDIIYWDRVEGATGAIDKLQVIDEVEVEGDNYDFDDEETPKSQQGLFKTPSEILNVVYKNVINKKMKVAFILNWSEYLFSTTGLSEDERQNITLLGKALKDRKVDYLNSDVNESVVIIICNKASGLPLSFYNGNPEVELVTLQKPDREERKAMIAKIEDSFEVRVKPGTDSLLDKENLSFLVNAKVGREKQLYDTTQ